MASCFVPGGNDRSGPMNLTDDEKVGSLGRWKCGVCNRPLTRDQRCKCDGSDYYFNGNVYPNGVPNGNKK